VCRAGHRGRVYGEGARADPCGRWRRPSSRRWRGDDPGPLRGASLLAVGHTDMRRGMNNVALQVQQVLKRDPHAGDLYVFRGKRGQLIKILFSGMTGSGCRSAPKGWSAAGSFGRRRPTARWRSAGCLRPPAQHRVFGAGEGQMYTGDPCFSTPLIDAISPASLRNPHRPTIRACHPAVLSLRPN